MVVSYRLSIVTVALSVTIRPQFAIECLRRSNQQGVAEFGPKFRVFPLEQTRRVWVAKNEHPRLTNGEINLEEFQPMWSQFTNVTDRQTDKRTDRQMTCDRNTALCTKVHHAVKINKHVVFNKNEIILQHFRLQYSSSGLANASTSSSIAQCSRWHYSMRRVCSLSSVILTCYIIHRPTRTYSHSNMLCNTICFACLC